MSMINYLLLLPLFLGFFDGNIDSLMVEDRPGSVLVDASSTEFLVGRHVFGDCDFYGNNVEIEVTVSVRSQANQVIAYIDATLREGGDEGEKNTKVEIEESFVLYNDRNSNRVIKHFDLPQNYSSFSWVQEGLRPINRTFSSKCFSRLYIVGDTKGCDVGRAGLKVYFPSFYVTLD